MQITPLSDLVISEIDAPTNGVYAGQTITLSWTECNIGDAYTDAPLWDDHVWLYSDTNLTHLAQDYATFPNPSFLGPGECYQQTVNLALPAALSGPYYFVVQANSDLVVHESNSANNLAVSASPILVDIQALTLGTPVTNTLSTGTEWFYKVQVGAGFNPCDPNEKIGPSGYGLQAFVNSSNPMPYTIYFENLPTAGTYARQIQVTDILDPNLDIRTFRLGQIAFGTNSVSVPDNLSFFQTRVNMPDQGTNIVVDISTGIDLAAGSVFWTLTAIDLNTGEPPLSANQGVLAPDTPGHLGEGSVAYTIEPLAGRATGAFITNQAIVVFDMNAPIPTAITTNTIDGAAPTSLVAPLPAVTLNTSFLVS